MIYQAYGSLAWYDATKEKRIPGAPFYDCENRGAILEEKETKGLYGNFMRQHEDMEPLELSEHSFEAAKLNTLSPG